MPRRSAVLIAALALSACGASRPAVERGQRSTGGEDELLVVELSPQSTFGELRQVLLAHGHRAGGRVRIAMGETEIVARITELPRDHLLRDPFVPVVALRPGGVAVTASNGFLSTNCTGLTTAPTRVAGRVGDGYDIDRLRACLRRPWLGGFESVFITSRPETSLEQLYLVIEAAHVAEVMFVLEPPCWFEGIDGCRDERAHRALRRLMREREGELRACLAPALERGAPLRGAVRIEVTTFPGVAQLVLTLSDGEGEALHDPEVERCVERVTWPLRGRISSDFSVEVELVIRVEAPPRSGSEGERPGR